MRRASFTSRLSPTAGLKVEGLENRFGAQAHLLVFGKFLDQELRNSFRAWVYWH
ncbi:transposase domain protein [Pseudarthrobacter siccitolerans]|uniref:Transposase domain protein n=1 Tax=Pseudarthrobacter siccitolerans TaxID=861266 RepID=A0A024H8F7_9MICC|nr:transposase domain protein [Pseudarthrobacter siccitolerans]